MREQKEERSKMSLLNKGLGIGASAIPVAEFVFYKNSAPISYFILGGEFFQ